MKKILMLVLSIGMLGASCNMKNANKTITGSGINVSRSYNIEHFKDIDISSSITAELIQGSTFEVKLEGDDNILPEFLVRLVGEKLVIKPKSNLNIKIKGPVKAIITAPEFRKLEATGACRFTCKTPINYDAKIEIDLSGSSEARLEVNTPKIDAELSGASKLFLRGATEQLSIDGSGSSLISCFDLKANIVKVDMSGAGNAEVTAQQKLEVDVSGASHVMYKGNPVLTESVSGAGSVRKVD